MFKNYYNSENLKMKRTFVKILIIVMPILNVLLSKIGVDYFVYNIYNWWYVVMLPGTLAVMCALVARKDKIFHNRAVLTLPIDLKKVWISKILICIKYLAISCSIIFIGAQIVQYSMNQGNIKTVSVLNGFIAIIVLILVTLWQIPLCLYLSSKLNFFVAIMISLVGNCLLGLVAVKDFWYVMPYSYAQRLMIPILKILPNGLMAIPESFTYKQGMLDMWVVPFGIAVTLLLFVATSYTTAVWYSRQEAK